MDKLKLTSKQKLTGAALTGIAALTALTASQIENGKPQPARVEMTAAPNAEVTTTTTEKAKPIAKTAVKAVIPSTTSTTEAPTTTTTLPKPPETTTTSTVAEKAPEAWQLAALAMANPQVGQNIEWLNAEVIVKPGAKLFSAPSTHATALEIADQTSEVKFLGLNPIPFDGPEGTFICFNTNSGLACTNDYGNVMSVMNGQESPLDPGATAKNAAIVSYVDQSGAYINPIGSNANLTAHGVPIGQSVEAFHGVSAEPIVID